MKFIAVDYQGDFAERGGRWYQERPCEAFIRDIFIPFCKDHQITISEIVSDYRLPRPSETLAYCVPGTKGYASLLPEKIKSGNVWIKCMNSPVWIRENAGEVNKSRDSRILVLTNLRIGCWQKLVKFLLRTRLLSLV